VVGTEVNTLGIIRIVVIVVQFHLLELGVGLFTQLVQFGAYAVGANQVHGVGVREVLVVFRSVAGGLGAPNHVNVQVGYHLIQRHYRSVVGVVFRAQQAQFFPGMKNHQNGPLGTIQRHSVGDGQHRGGAGAIVISAVIDLAAGAGL